MLETNKTTIKRKPVTELRNAFDGSSAEIAEEGISDIWYEDMWIETPQA